MLEILSTIRFNVGIINRIDLEYSNLYTVSIHSLESVCMKKQHGKNKYV